MNVLLRPIDAILPRAARSFGGKAKNLAALARAGFPVPAAYALSSEVAERAFAACLPPQLLPSALFAGSLPAEADLAEARERVLHAELAPDLAQSLRNAFHELLAQGAPSVAVRSSSTAEDTHAASAAGLHTSVLNVTGEAALFQAVRECWASVFSQRVFLYLQALGAKDAGSVGVLVQAMVPGEVAGVLFSANPLTNNPREMVINAAYGLGVSVADGRVSPDTYYIDKDTGFLRDRVIGDKAVRTELDPAGGVREQRISGDLARKEALDEHTLSRLIDLGARIERHFGDARDVEWVKSGEEIYVLQARPITLGIDRSERRKLRAKRGGRSAHEPGTVWSNLNVGEALPGVATPLTWSVLSNFSDFGFRKAFAALGCSVPKGASFVGNFRGRIYLNLTELAEVASQVPGLSPRNVLPLGGGAEVDRLERDVKSKPSLRFVSRLPLTAARFVRENLGLGRRVERFEPGFQEEVARIRALDLRILPSPSLDETLSDVHRLLSETGGLMLTAYGSLLAALVPLSAALRAFAGDGADKMQLDLLSSLRDVESADPGREIARIAGIAKLDEPARTVLQSKTKGLRLEELPLGPTRTAIHAFLLRHGHRGVREAELAEPRWREDPTLLFDTIRLHLGRAEPPSSVDKSEALRAQGEAALLSLSLPARGAIMALLGVVRRSMRLRERLRGHVVQVLDLFRILCCDVSRRIAIREPGIGPDAAFFLTLPEVHAFLRGELRAVRPLVRMRRAAYGRDRSLPDPPDTFVDYPPPVTQLAARKRELEGLAASSGQVSGRARVLVDARAAGELQPGEILVVPAADIGWSPLFLVAAGLATDLGGPLSHACVVAREYGIPAVVNLRVATRAVKTGDQVLLDGDAGKLLILDEAHG